MKGFSPFILILLAIGSAGFGLTAAILNDAPGVNATDNLTGQPGELIDIGTEAAYEFPLQGFLDLLFAGVKSVMNWIVSFVILPVINWITALLGYPFEAPYYLGLLIFVALLFVVMYKKWKWLANFLFDKAIITGLIIGGIIFIIIVLAMLGVG